MKVTDIKQLVIFSKEVIFSQDERCYIQDHFSALTPFWKPDPSFPLSLSC